MRQNIDESTEVAEVCTFTRLYVSVSLAIRQCTALFSLARSSLRHSGGGLQHHTVHQLQCSQLVVQDHLATIYSLVVPVVLHLLTVYQLDSRGLARVFNIQHVPGFEF